MSWSRSSAFRNGLDLAWKVVGTADFNGDGQPDLLLQNQTTGAVIVWTLNGTTVTGGAYIIKGLDLAWTIVGP